MWKIAVPAVLIVVIAGCASGPDPVVTHLVAVSDRDESPDEALWRDAWNSLTLGAGKLASADGWTLRRWRDGEIDAVKRMDHDVVHVGAPPSDELLLRAAWTRLSTTPGVNVDGVQLQILHRRATLRGRMSSREAAASAVRLVASTRGVEAVRSFLVWEDR
jgi:hypothetical protein